MNYINEKALQDRLDTVRQLADVIWDGLLARQEYEMEEIQNMREEVE